MATVIGLTLEERNYAQRIINHLNQPAWMTEDDQRIIKLIIRLVQAHDEVLVERNNLLTNHS